MAAEQFVVFELANEEYAIPNGQVNEVICYAGVTPLPNALGYLNGSINLRGMVIPIFDLADKFSIASEKSSARQALIVKISGQDVGLLVDTVTEVTRLDDSAIEPVNEIIIANACIKAIGKVDNRLLNILNLNELFTPEEMTALENVR